MTDTAFTPEALQALAAPLDPARVAVLRDGPAAGTPYMIGHEIIETLSRIFGHGNWGFSIAGQPWCIEQGPLKDGRKRSYELWGVMGTLTVRGGLPISDIGTCVRNGDGHAGLDMAIKGAVTDCVKRCARNYGDQFGLVLYDRTVSGSDLKAEYDDWTRAQRGGTPTPHVTMKDALIAGSAPDKGGVITEADIEEARRAEVKPSEETVGLGNFLKENAWKFADEHVRMVLQQASNDAAGVNVALDRWFATHPAPREEQRAALAKQIRDMRIELDKHITTPVGASGWS